MGLLNLKGVSDIRIFQHCYIEMAVGRESRDIVNLIPDKIQMKQDLNMHIRVFREINFSTKN